MRLKSFLGGLDKVSLSWNSNWLLSYLMFFPSPSFPPYTAIQNRNPVWYQALTHGLNEEQRKQLQDIATLADQRRAAHGMLVNHNSSLMQLMTSYSFIIEGT